LLPLVLVFCNEEEELAPPVDRLAGVVMVATVVALAALAVDAALADGDDVVDVVDTLSFFWLDMVATTRSAEPNTPCLSTQTHARSSHTTTVMYLQPNRYDLNLAVVVGYDLLLPTRPRNTHVHNHAGVWRVPSFFCVVETFDKLERIDFALLPTNRNSLASVAQQPTCATMQPRRNRSTRRCTAAESLPTTATMPLRQRVASLRVVVAAMVVVVVSLPNHCVGTAEIDVSAECRLNTATLARCVAPGVRRRIVTTFLIPTLIVHMMTPSSSPLAWSGARSISHSPTPSVKSFASTTSDI
jgi:hypothetical protein